MGCDWALAHGHRSAAVFVVRGKAHRKLGNLREAIADADEALRECPSSCEALVLRGQAQLEMREASAALTDLNKAIEMAGAPSAVRASALASRADAFVALQQYQKAVADCDEALQLCRNPLALAIRGEAKLLSCEYKAAVADCSAVMISAGQYFRKILPKEKRDRPLSLAFDSFLVDHDWALPPPCMVCKGGSVELPSSCSDCSAVAPQQLAAVTLVFLPNL